MGGQQPLKRAVPQVQTLEEERKKGRVGEMIPTGMGQMGWRQIGVPWSQVSQLSSGVKQPWCCEAPPHSGGGQRDPGPRARLLSTTARALT